MKIATNLALKYSSSKSFIRLYLPASEKIRFTLNVDSRLD